jgi:hypothetical protein
MAPEVREQIEATRRSAVDGGRIPSISARSTVPVAHSLDTRLSRYLSANSRVNADRHRF